MIELSRVSLFKAGQELYTAVYHAVEGFKPVASWFVAGSELGIILLDGHGCVGFVHGYPLTQHFEKLSEARTYADRLNAHRAAEAAANAPRPKLRFRVTGVDLEVLEPGKEAWRTWRAATDAERDAFEAGNLYKDEW